ncbi:AAA family ATPase [Nocardioides lijunqiniae]|uniref:AAA family ATPase n=1 Tax=Nocardioides lijunqiniae TaxID=2760832 RepID=UPI0030B7FE40
MAELVGRHAERAAVQQLLTAASAGSSGTLVIRGQAGIGKTALLHHAQETAVPLGFSLTWCTGAESESQFAFAGLHQLCAPLLDKAGALTAPQEDALGVALGRREGPAPNGFLVGLATLNLLAEAAEEAPLLCVIDDAQWLDTASAQVLAFVARRLGAERVAMVFAVREVTAGEVDVLAGLPLGLELRGLEESDARALLDGGVHAPMDDFVRDRIVAEARGNPLALLELPRSARLTQLAGGFELPDALSVPRRIEDGFQRHSAAFSSDTQLLLLLAAADPTGDASLLWRAAGRLEIPQEAVEPAESSGLVEIDTRVRFRHPLVRSAVYRAATPANRRRAHGALAAETDAVKDPDRRAWHRAHAVYGTDEEAAADLERTADRTRARGGVAAAAAFLHQAVGLTPDPSVRATRALAAAHAKHDAGSSGAARDLAAIAEIGPLDDWQRARLALLRARIAFNLTQAPEVPWMLLDAAAALAPMDAGLARETYLHALDAVLLIGGGDRGGVLDVAAVALAAPAAPVPLRPSDLLLDGLVTTFTRGYVAGFPDVRRALEAFRDRGVDGEALGEMGSRRWLSLATRVAVGLYEDDLACALAERNVGLAREAGALATLPQALAALSAMLVLTGELPQAGELAAEGSAITLATGAAPVRFAQLFLHAWRGHEAETAQLFADSTQRAHEGGADATLAAYALAVLYNGLGKYPEAQDAAMRARQSYELTNSSRGLALPELVEAAVRADQPETATAALDELVVRTGASGTAFARGLEARSRALVSTGASAEGHYREAIEQLRACRMVTYLARTHLVYGEWLRREGRRQDAREQLRTAHELLTDMGADAFAARAARELRATGEHPRRRSAHPTSTLTDHELQIARLVATGATSREVGAQLFLSPRTIESHLRNIFRKLGISSRRQLKDLQLP